VPLLLCLRSFTPLRRAYVGLWHEGIHRVNGKLGAACNRVNNKLDSAYNSSGGIGLTAPSKLRLVRECLVLTRTACRCYFGANPSQILRYYYERSKRVSGITTDGSRLVLLVTSGNRPPRLNNETQLVSWSGLVCTSPLATDGVVSVMFGCADRANHLLYGKSA
jgi:hypothetical protein